MGKKEEKIGKKGKNDKKTKLYKKNSIENGFNKISEGTLKLTILGHQDISLYY